MFCCRHLPERFLYQRVALVIWKTGEQKAVDMSETHPPPFGFLLPFSVFGVFFFPLLCFCFSPSSTLLFPTRVRMPCVSEEKL